MYNSPGEMSRAVLEYASGALLEQNLIIIAKRNLY